MHNAGGDTRSAPHITQTPLLVFLPGLFRPFTTGGTLAASPVCFSSRRRWICIIWRWAPPSSSLPRKTPTHYTHHRSHCLIDPIVWPGFSLQAWCSDPEAGSQCQCQSQCLWLWRTGADNSTPWLFNSTGHQYDTVMGLMALRGNTASVTPCSVTEPWLQDFPTGTKLTEWRCCVKVRTFSKSLLYFVFILFCVLPFC